MSADPKALRPAEAEVDALRRRAAQLEGLLDRQRQEQARFLEIVLDSMDDGVAITDQQGRLTRVNPAAAKIIGIDSSQPDAVNQWFASAYLSDGCTPYPPHNRPLTRAIRGEPVKGEEILFLHPETWEALWLQVSARPLVGGEGACYGALLVFRDITVQRRALTALRETEQRFQSMLRNTPAVV